MDKVRIGEGAVVKRAIIDKNVKVPAGAAIGLDPDLDRARGFKVTESGITVLAKDQVVPEPEAPNSPWLPSTAARFRRRSRLPPRSTPTSGTPRNRSRKSRLPR